MVDDPVITEYMCVRNLTPKAYFLGVTWLVILCFLMAVAD